MIGGGWRGIGTLALVMGAAFAALLVMGYAVAGVLSLLGVG